MTAAPLSRAPEPASPAKNSYDADQLAKFANTMIHDHNKVLEHHDESNTLSLETIMEKLKTASNGRSKTMWMRRKKRRKL